MISIDLRCVLAKLERKFFHCYATANDKRFYLEDIKNLKRILMHDAGVGKIYLYIAISLVNKQSYWDDLFVKNISKMFSNQDRVILKSIFFKDNRGRDFSSYSELKKMILPFTSDSDYVFFQNRSACGPYFDNWLVQFIEHFNKHDSIALCGSTINFNDHPKRSQRNDLPHIQTYAFVTSLKYLNMLPKVFPGEKEVDRLQIILNGEIGLSQFYLKRQFSIVCLEWPDEIIALSSKAISTADCKEKVKELHSFYHRHYINKNKARRIKNPLFPALSLYIKVMLGCKL